MTVYKMFPEGLSVVPLKEAEAEIEKTKAWLADMLEPAREQARANERERIAFELTQKRREIFALTSQDVYRLEGFDKAISLIVSSSIRQELMSLEKIDEDAPQWQELKQFAHAHNVLVDAVKALQEKVK